VDGGLAWQDGPSVSEGLDGESWRLWREEEKRAKEGLTDGIDYTLLIGLGRVRVSAIRYAATDTCYPCLWVVEADVSGVLMRGRHGQRVVPSRLTVVVMAV
jgi:hypothetical protein